MQYDKQTGTFFVDNDAICRGFYGTETHTMESFKLTPPANRFWTITEAKNGTGLRLFSLSKDEWKYYKYYSDRRGDHEYCPWRETQDRVWILSTFKSLEGHFGRWKDKNCSKCRGGITRNCNCNMTYGEMFDDILGEDGVHNVMLLTATGELCVSYFMRHRENDIFNEMGDEESHVIQTLIWNRRLQCFSGPSFPTYNPEHPNSPYWVQPPPQVRSPNLLYCNGVVDPNASDVETYFTEDGDLKIKDGQPLLLTVYDGPQLQSFKLITESDECVRQFRCRSHNRFVALLVTENLAKKDSKHEKELEHAKARLFTKDELDGYKVNLQCGKDLFFNQLKNKFMYETTRNRNYFVTFDRNLFNTLRIQDVCDEMCVVDQYDEHFDEVCQEFCSRVWDKLMQCTNWRKVRAVESFWKFCAKSTVV